MKDTQRGGARRAWDAFLAGALRPSLPGLVGVLGVAASLIAAAAVRVTPDSLRVLELPFYLQRQGPDPALRATQAALRAGHFEPHPNAVGIFGASALLSALEKSEQVSEVFRDVGGREIPVSVLCVPGIAIYELLVQIELTKASCPGALVIGVSPMKVGSRAAFEPELARLGLVEPRFSTGVYLVDQWVFLVPVFEHALRAWLRFHAPFVRSPRPSAPPVAADTPGTISEEELRRDLPWRTEIVAQGLAHAEDPESGLASLERMLSRLRDEERLVVLLESVLDPRLRENLDPAAWADYQARMTALAERHGAHYWDLGQVAELGPDDFFDLGHVGRLAARQRFTRALAARLAPLVDSGDPVGGER